MLLLLRQRIAARRSTSRHGILLLLRLRRIGALAPER
jgi:hypothetical protein